MGKSGLQPGRGLIQRGRESLHARQIWRWQWVYSFPTDSSSDILEFISCSTFSRPLVGPPHGYISLTVQTETAVNRDRVGRKWGVCLLWHATAVGMCAVFLPSASEGVFIYWATGCGGIGIDLFTSRRICRKTPEGRLSFSLTVWHLRGKGERRVCRHQQLGLISLPHWHQILRAFDAPRAARGATIYSSHSARGFKTQNIWQVGCCWRAE